MSIVSIFNIKLSEFKKNDFQILTLYISEEFMPDFERNKNKLNFFIDGLVLGLVTAGIVLSIFVFIFCIYDPREGILLGRLIPMKFYNSICPSGFLVALFYAYLILILEATICTTGSLVLIYMFYLTVLLDNEFHLNSTKKYRTTNLFREPENLRNSYRTLQILNEYFLCFIKLYVTLFHWLFSVFPVFANNVLMRYWNSFTWIEITMLIFATLVVITFWMLTLQFGKYLWIKGQQNLHSWICVNSSCLQREKRVMAKFRRSCRPILIRHGNMLVLGRMTQFIYVKSIILYTGKSWLAFKQK